jgi:hypothetical protein
MWMGVSIHCSRYLQKVRVKLNERNQIKTEFNNGHFRMIDFHQFVLAETQVNLDEYIELHITVEVRKKDSEQEAERLEDLRRIEMAISNDRVN